MAPRRSARARWTSTGAAALSGVVVLTTTYTSWAGCAVDRQEQTRQGAAPFVASGTVTGLEIVERDGRTVVFARVAAEELHRGSLAMGGFRIQTGLPNLLDVSPWVPAPGTRVYAIGEPDGDGAIAHSPCTRDVGRLPGGINLEKLARKDPGGHFEGVAPTLPHPTGPTLPAQPSGWTVYTTVDGSLRTADWVADAGENDVLLSMPFPRGGAVRVAISVPVHTLHSVVTETTPLAEGAAISWWAGVRLDDDGVPLPLGGVEALSPVPAGVRGLRWRPADQPPPPAGAPRLVLRRPLTLHAEPGGTPLVRLIESPPTRIFASGPPEDGWQRIAVRGPALHGDAWASDADLATPPDAGVVGGVAGGVVGGVLSNAQPVQLLVPPGTSILRPGTGDVFARTDDPWRATWLTTAQGRAWVVVPTLEGPQVGELLCEPDDSRTRCAVR